MSEASEITNVREMGSLLLGDQQGEAGASESPDPGTDPQDGEREAGGPEFFTDIAKEAGIDPERLYKSHIKLDDETSISWEQIKDQARQWADAAQASEAQAERESEFRAERVKWLQQAQLAASGNDPEQVKQLIQQARDYEAERVKQFLPEWSDSKVERRDRELIGDYLARFGIQAALLDEMFDAAGLALLHDAATRWKRASQTLEKEIKPRKRGMKASARESRPGGKLSGDDVVKAFREGKLGEKEALGRLLTG